MQQVPTLGRLVIPSFTDMMKYDFFRHIYDSIQYPVLLVEINQIAEEDRIPYKYKTSGTVFVSFEIDFDGNVKNVYAPYNSQETDPTLNYEVRQAFRSAPKLDFEQYLQDNYDDLNGKDPLSIKILYILPVKFALEIVERQTVNVYY